MVLALQARIINKWQWRYIMYILYGKFTPNEFHASTISGGTGRISIRLFPIWQKAIGGKMWPLYILFNHNSLNEWSKNEYRDAGNQTLVSWWFSLHSSYRNVHHVRFAIIYVYIILNVCHLPRSSIFVVVVDDQ